ncbi:biopolymer transporter ExbD [Pelagicoccus mobilis]|uniref:Biopolymer transporter ExbD n=2 Tax=Pelagicoccus mobilis TaxID=415221 RepID=A0A934VR03_9BACT|nr:biopolymer transporter ExbD [Pelagicoccus mobilis]
MIDMVFLLLVFFMTASAMSQAGSKLELELPESANAKVSRDYSDRLIVSLDADGQVYLGASLIEEEGLSRILSEFRRERSKGKLSIRAAKGTPFAAIRKVMGLAAEAGIHDYLYASHETGGAG